MAYSAHALRPVQRFLAKWKGCDFAPACALDEFTRKLNACIRSSIPAGSNPAIEKTASLRGRCRIAEEIPISIKINPLAGRRHLSFSHYLWLISHVPGNLLDYDG
jgi:hypothetical protein